MNRHLKNLYANYRYFGWRTLVNQKEFYEADERNDFETAERCETIAWESHQKYELLKQIMIKR